MKKGGITILVFGVIFLLGSCVSFNTANSPFEITDATVKMLKGKTTNQGEIEFTLDNVKESVEVESVIFNRMLIPVETEMNGDQATVRGNFMLPLEGDINNDLYIDASNRINYSKNGAESFVQYNRIHRIASPIIRNF